MTEFYCPKCGWRVDVADAAAIPDCGYCQGPVIAVNGKAAAARRARKTNVLTPASQPASAKPNPFYRRGEG